MDTIEQPASEWSWQGFAGPQAAAQAAYDAIVIGPEIGARVPYTGGPVAVNTRRTLFAFGVQTRTGSPIPVPPGMDELNPAMVGRMLGA